MSALKAYAGVARAPFLVLPITLIAAGTAASFHDGAFNWVRTLLATLGLVVLHMAVNIFNEWSDHRTGIDFETERTPFSGGSGTLPDGALAPRSALIFGIVCAAVGLAIGIWFLLQVGWILLPILVAGAVCVVTYTDLLARIGIGELAAGFGLGGLPVIGAALVVDGSIGAAAFAAAVPATLVTFNLLLLNEFPDESADRKGGRRNLVLLLGRGAAARVWAAAVVATPLAIFGAVGLEILPVFCIAAALPSLLLVKGLGWAFANPESAVPIPALAANVIWNLASNSLMAAALVAAKLI